MRRHGKFIVMILLLVVSLAIFGTALYRMIAFGGIVSCVLLCIGIACVGQWTDEFICRLRAWRSKRRGKNG